MPKISIIVPSFNSKNTIHSCLDSIVGQTMDDVEIIVVDDHSTDDSMDVVQDYVSSYTGPKQFVIAQTTSGKGPGAARNTGIETAKGEYIGFVDSDDLIDENFCDSLYRAATSVNADMAFCNISFDYSDGRSTVKNNPNITNGTMTLEAKKKYFRKYITFFTTYIYKRSMLNTFGIRFPQTRSAEDSCFLACCLLASSSMAAVYSPLYHYVISLNSISQKKDPERYRQKLASFRQLRDFAKKHNLYTPYRSILEFIIFKKGIIGAAKEFLKNNL